MKISLFLFVVSINILLANDLEGCKISFFKKEGEACPKPNSIISIPPIVIEKKSDKDLKVVKVKLIKILKDVKEFKEKNSNKTEKLLNELNRMKKEFQYYKLLKEKELLQVNKKLKRNKKQLYVTKKRLGKVKKKIIKKEMLYKKKIAKLKKISKPKISKPKISKPKISKPKISKPKISKPKISKPKISKPKISNPIREEIVPQEIIESTYTITANEPVIQKLIEPIKSPKKISWVEITVADNLNIYDLALEYYGDAQEYEKIYLANRDIITPDYQLRNGMSIKIPITDKFEEQPFMINSSF